MAECDCKENMNMDKKAYTGKDDSLLAILNEKIEMHPV